MTHTGLATAIVLLCATLTVQTQSQSALERSWPTEGPPRPLTARPVKFPPYEIRTLGNGLQVVLVSHHEQPAVSARMIVRAGAARDPKGKLGVAMLTSSLLDQGAGSKTAQQIADTIDFAGGLLGTGAGSDLSYVNTIVMKDGLQLGLDLMAEVIRHPTFAPEEINRQKQQALSSLKVSLDDPDNVADQVIDRLIYGFHPYGLPGSGTPETLASLTREDFVDFHRQFYLPNNALLAIVGDVSPEEAMAGVEKAFGDWEPHEVPDFAPTAPPPPVKRVVVIDKPDAVQTEIRVGQLGVERKNKDFVALDQAVKILGGEGANRLQQVLRTERGLTYGASADLDAYKVAGGIVAETNTRTETTAESLRVMVDQILRVQTERVYEGELQGAQNYLVGHFPLTIETPDAIATQVLNQLFYELPLEELQEYRQRVLSVVPADIQRVAKTYFMPDRLGIVLVGNADGFAKELAGIGYPQFERIPIEEVDLLAATLRHANAAVRPLAGAPDAAGVAPSFAYTQSSAAAQPKAGESAQALALIRKAADARGGIEKLSAIKAISADSDTSLTTPQGKLTAKTRTFIQYPDRIRVEADLPGGQQTVQVFADGKGWVKDPTGVHDVPEEMLGELRASTRRDSLSLIVGAATGKLAVAMLPEEGFKGKTLKVVSVSGEGLSPVRLYIDPDAAVVVKLAYDRPVDDPRFKGPAVTEEIYDDYREVEGVQFAFKATVTQGGMTILERALTALKINPTLQPDLFAKPK